MSSQPFADDLQETLVAIDGELDSETSRQIEERLARDPALRRHLQSLERSWDLLDRLPRADVGEKFTRTTVEMVAVAAEQEIQQQRDKLPRLRRRRWLLTVACIAAAGFAGFAAFERAVPNRNQQLLEDLPAIENIELYQHADNIDFLRKLHEERVFAEDDDDAP